MSGKVGEEGTCYQCCNTRSLVEERDFDSGTWPGYGKPVAKAICAECAGWLDSREDREGEID